MARVDEFEFLSDLAFRSKATWGYSTTTMEIFRGELTLSPNLVGQVFVGEWSGARDGFYSLGESSSARVELCHLFVEPVFMGRGYGRELLLDAADRCRAHHFETLVIHGDPHALDFYARMGAARIGEVESGSIAGRMLPLFELNLRNMK